jgi:hypothetical protein
MDAAGFCARKTSTLIALHRGGTGHVYPTGGYKAVTPIQLANGLALLGRRLISFRAFRVYLACFELVAEREAASRAAPARRGRRSWYRPEEVLRLVPDADLPAVGRALRSLARFHLLQFAENSIAMTQTPLPESCHLLPVLAGGRSVTRPIPIPRRLIAYLCRSTKPALVKTTLAYAVRGLSVERGTGAVRSAGTVKATWIADALGISERATRAARAELIRLGIITKDTGSHQRKLNRDGAYFRINLDWSAPESQAAATRSTLQPSPATLRFAPPTPEFEAQSAPPDQKPETPQDLKDQKLEHRAAGFFGEAGEPRLRDIRPEDIRKVASLRALFEQATAARWLPRGEASFLAFAAAAVRANRATGDPVRIFVAIVKRKLWHHITQADEERARAVVAREHPTGMPAFVRELIERAAA